MIPNERQRIAALMRRDFMPFLIKSFETLEPGKSPLRPSWYLMAICYALVTLWLAQSDRLSIFLPPRHLKSITTAVAFSAWLLGQDPTLKIMIASYSDDLSRKHARMTKTIMES